MIGIKGLANKMDQQGANPEISAMINELTNITVTYKDDDRMPWSNDGKGENVPLTEELLEKLNDGSISDATISMGMNQIKVKEGKVIDISDGLEDKIPQSVMDDAAKFSIENNKAITVVPFAKVNTIDSKLQYMYTDDSGHILTLSTTKSPNGGVVRVDPNKPTHNHAPGSGGADKIIGSNENAPHVDNPTELEGASKDNKTKTEQKPFIDENGAPHGDIPLPNPDDQKEATPSDKGYIDGSDDDIIIRDYDPFEEKPTEYMVDGRTNLEDKFNIAVTNENSWSVKKSYEREPFGNTPNI